MERLVETGGAFEHFLQDGRLTYIPRAEILVKSPIAPEHTMDVNGVLADFPRVKRLIEGAGLEHVGHVFYPVQLPRVEWVVEGCMRK